MRTLWIGLFVVGCKGGSDKPNVVDDAPPVVDPDAAIDAPPDAYQILGSTAMSGTRLKVAWATTSDGVKIDVPTFDASNSYDFHDSVFQKPCRVETWTDGMKRCTPDAQDVFYSDDQCGTPIAAIPGGTTPPAFWRERANTSTGNVNQLSTLGAQVAGTQYWQRVGAICDGPYGVGLGGKLHALTPVSGMPVITEVRTGSGALQQRWWTSSDGLQVPRRRVAYDATIAADCDIRLTSSVNPIEAGFCSLTRETRHYHDTACTIPVVRTPPASLPTYVSSACSRKVHTLGAMTTSSPLTHRSLQQACSSVTPPAGGDAYYLFGPEVGEMQVVTLSQESAPGHRLQPIVLSSLDLWSGWFHDTVLDLDCFLTRNGCRPSVISTRRVYTDAQCTVPIDVVEITEEHDPACPAARPHAFASDANNQVHRVAGQHVGSLRVKAGSNCDPISFETPPDILFFDLDPAIIPASAFETATYAVDP